MYMRWLILLAWLAALAGCTEFEYVDTRVLVVDATFGTPVPGAQVWASGYAHPLSFATLPETSSAISDVNGIAEVRVARYKDGAYPQVSVDAVARGYKWWCTSPKPLMEALDQAAASGTVVALTASLAPLGSPVQVVTVPDHYVGYVRITRVGSGNVPAVDTYVAGPDGQVTLPEIPGILSVHPLQVQFQRPSGWDIPYTRSWKPDFEIEGVTQLWEVDGAEVYFIGEALLLARERNLLWPSGKIDPDLRPAYEARVRAGRVPS